VANTVSYRLRFDTHLYSRMGAAPATAMAFVRNLRKPRFLTLCMGCNLCRPQETYANVGFVSGEVWSFLTELGSADECLKIAALCT
jgi:hypothetical protein